MTVMIHDVEDREKVTSEAVKSAEAKRVYTPDVDMIEKDDMIILSVDMPGCDEKSVDITLENNILTARGSAETDIPEGFKAAFEEYYAGDYEVKFVLSEEVDKNKIEAVMKDGVLRISIPKADVAKKRTIPVEISS